MASTGNERKSRILLVVSVVVLLVGLVGLAIPVATEMSNIWDTEQHISSIESAYDQMADEERAYLLNQAARYNAAVLSARRADDLLPYREQLAYGGIDMIAHLTIPSLALDLPIYHDTDDDTLMAGVGHLEGSALPVGTPGGRCVLAGHSGMSTSRMFDDIHLLAPGDRFVVWTLGDALAYEVVESKVVWPDETDELIPVPGEDLVTLVTCTPYGVNTHRLLVTGRRCEYVPDEEIVPDAEVYVNRRTIPLMIALGMVALVGSALGIAAAIRHVRRSNRRMADARKYG